MKERFLELLNTIVRINDRLDKNKNNKSSNVKYIIEKGKKLTNATKISEAFNKFFKRCWSRTS